MAHIEKDLPRTYKLHELFAAEGGLGQNEMKKVLKAYSIYNPTVGYCQVANYCTCSMFTIYCTCSVYTIYCTCSVFTIYCTCSVFTIYCTCSVCTIYCTCSVYTIYCTCSMFTIYCTCSVLTIYCTCSVFTIVPNILLLWKSVFLFVPFELKYEITK